MKTFLLFLILLPSIVVASDLDKIASLVDKESYVVNGNIVVIGTYMEYKKPDVTMVYKIDRELNILKETKIDADGFERFLSQPTEDGVSVLFYSNKDGKRFDINASSLEVSESSTNISKKVVNRSQYSKQTRVYLGDYYYSATNSNAYSNKMMILNLKTGEIEKMGVPDVEGNGERSWNYTAYPYKGIVVVSCEMTVDGVNGIGYHIFKNGKVTETKFVEFDKSLYPEYFYKMTFDDDLNPTISGGYKTKDKGIEHSGYFYIDPVKGIKLKIPLEDMKSGHDESINKGDMRFISRGVYELDGATILVFDAYYKEQMGTLTRRVYTMTNAVKISNSGEITWDTYHTPQHKYSGLNLDQNKDRGSIVSVDNDEITICYVGLDDLHFGTINSGGGISTKTINMKDLAEELSLTAASMLAECINEKRFGE